MKYKFKINEKNIPDGDKGEIIKILNAYGLRDLSMFHELDEVDYNNLIRDITIVLNR